MKKTLRRLPRFYGLLVSALVMIKRQCSGVRQFLEYKGQGGLGRLLIVAPGEKLIPVEGWGAVETIVDKQAAMLASRGWTVRVINAWGIWTWFRALLFRPSMVICHYDVFALPSRFLSKLSRARLISLTHYAYAAQPDCWDWQVRRRFHHVSRADTSVFLSSKIQKVWEAEFDVKKSALIPNFTDVEAFSFSSESNRPIRLICVGKVERRKRQVDLANLLPSSAPISFYGGIVDDRFASLETSKRELFKGEVTRQWLYEELTNFTHLVLCSDAEADALVLYEAQAAGLEIVVTPEALGSIDFELDWVHVVSFQELPEFISKLPPFSSFERGAIRTFSLGNYGVQKWIERWENILS